MGDKCPPLRLPIHVEASCGSKCGCDLPLDNCTTNCDIDTAVRFQGTYQNNCCEKVEAEASLSIAYLGNLRKNDCQPLTSIRLNPICLEWCQFLRLFYRSNNTFSILPSAANICAINFSGQTYENTTSKTLNLSLAQLIREAWASQCETTVDKVPLKTSILLNRQTSYTKSLLSSQSAITLSLDQAIDTLLLQNQIAPADSTQKATVNFIVQYLYTFEPLNVTVEINFVYKTKIPCYKNINICDDWCPPYSREYNCRTCGDLNNKNFDFSEIQKSFEAPINQVFENNSQIEENNSQLFENNSQLFENNSQLFENNSQLFENNSQLDENNSQSDDLGSISELKDMSKLGDDNKSYMTKDSSKWY